MAYVWLRILANLAQLPDKGSDICPESFQNNSMVCGLVYWDLYWAF